MSLEKFYIKKKKSAKYLLIHIQCYFEENYKISMLPVIYLYISFQNGSLSITQSPKVSGVLYIPWYKMKILVANPTTQALLL